jgi:DNA invertase Pin-like site-specific DNA recombinase
MNQVTQSVVRPRRCVIYTRKSTEEGLEQAFNSLDAQREACEAYIHSQRHEGWMLQPEHYDDGGYSGGNMKRPALTQLMADLKAGLVDVIVVYKIDRLSRSLSDFVRMIELFEQHEVSFVSVTQQFNTSTSMGRLTLNVLLSFAQFEREVTSERIRDKLAASAKKGLWLGGPVPLGYDVMDKQLVINDSEAHVVRHIYQRYLALQCVRRLKAELDTDGYVSKRRKTASGVQGGQAFSRGALYTILKNPIYIGKVRHKQKIYNGQHKAIIEHNVWKRVQAQLAANRSKRQRRTAARHPALLAGLLYDDQGHRMSPSHGNKNRSRRYRYYVSQAVLKYQDKEAGSVSRIAAHTIEALVICELLSLLQDDLRLLAITDAQDISLDQRSALLTEAQRLASQWKKIKEQDRLTIMNKVVKRVTVGRQQVTLTFSKIGLLQRLGYQSVITHGSDDYLINRAVCLQRCGIES